LRRIAQIFSFYSQKLLKTSKPIAHKMNIYYTFFVAKNKEENPLLAQGGSHFPSENKED